MTKERLIFTDLTNNNNKYWVAEISGTTVTYKWGRVGDDRGQTTIKTYTSDATAQTNFEKKVAEKLKKGYTRQMTVEDNRPISVAYVAKVQIDHSQDKETADLIDFLVKRNIHQIEGTTNIRLEAGRLTTPLGPVTEEGLKEAEAILAKMQRAKTKDLDLLANDYLRIVPRDIGRRRVSATALFGTQKQLEQEQATIDSLRAVVEDLADKEEAASEEAPVVFSTKLEIITASDKEFKRIDKFFRGNINRNHHSANMKLSRAWSMSIKASDDAFNHKIGNIKELWHGTKDANLLSILKNGFIIPKRNSGIAITGRMFGDGVYFSDQSTKSLNYASGFWGGGKSQRAFMLLNDVAMGREYIPTRGFGMRECPKGYDSTFAKAGKSGVINNEMIVYKENQIKPTFLCEFN